MTVNVGNLDRIVRLILGVVLIAAPFLSGLALFDTAWIKYVSVIVGVVMLVVSLTRSCPIYSIFGMRTCKAK